MADRTKNEQRGATAEPEAPKPADPVEPQTSTASAEDPGARRYTVERILRESGPLLGVSGYVAAGAFAEREATDEMTKAEARQAVESYLSREL